MTQPIDPSPSAASTSSDALSHESERVLAELAETNRLRELRTVVPRGKTILHEGRTLLNLASNDYLGLSQHPRLIEAAIRATQEHGVGSGASRLISGTLPIHQEAEQRFATLKHAEAALLLPTGYTANLAALTTLAGPGDLIVLDKLVHASLIDAARASGAEVRTYPHLQLDRAERLLMRQATGRRLLVSDSVFSMDGDIADLPALCDLADRTDAVLVVDEAHGTGVLSEDGSGLASAQGVADRVYSCGAGGVVISTASKALGSLGGLITAQRVVIDLIINKARPFIYSTAVPASQAAAIIASIEVLQAEPEHRRSLIHSSKVLRQQLNEIGWATHNSSIATPIIPLLAGSEADALALQARLDEAGIFAPAIRPPTVAPGSCRVRLSLRADLTEQDLRSAIDAIGPPPPNVIM